MRDGRKGDEWTNFFLDDSVDRLKALARDLKRQAKEALDPTTSHDCRANAEAIRIVLAALAEAVNCPSCAGRGRRWYSFIGDATCDKCKGSGKR